MNFTKAQQQSVIIGTILGDGYLQMTGKQNARLRLEHSALQTEYIRWKIDVLSYLFHEKWTELKRIHPKTGRTYFYVRAQSYADDKLGELHKLFYENKKKHIPYNLRELLTPLSLAVWYMDDGYYYNRDRCSYLYLGKVSIEEANIVKDALWCNMSLFVKVLDKKQKGYAIYFSPGEVNKLNNVINPYILPIFSYKLPS